MHFRIIRESLRFLHLQSQPMCSQRKSECLGTEKKKRKKKVNRNMSGCHQADQVRSGKTNKPRKKLVEETKFAHDLDVHRFSKDLTAALQKVNYCIC